MNHTSDQNEQTHPQSEEGGFGAWEYTCWDCQHCFFRTVLYGIHELEIKFEPIDYQILSKPSSCPKCSCKKLHAIRFSWYHLPKEFVVAKLEYLLDNLSAEALYEVIFYLKGGALSGKRRDFIGKFYLKAARLGSPRAMQEMIYLYEVGQHVPQSILRSIAWAKRRYDYAGGEQPQLFEYLLVVRNGWDLGIFFEKWKEKDA